MIAQRIARLRSLLDALKLDAFLFIHPANIRYFSGFTGSESVLIVDREKVCFLTDSRYTQQALTEVTGDEIREYKVQETGVESFFVGRKIVRVGFEAASMSFGRWQRFEKNIEGKREWVPLDDEICSLRGKKDPDEIEHIRRAARLNREAFTEIVPMIRPGVKERDVALELEFALKKKGGEEKAFDFIVASGCRGALPHGIASDKIIEEGELVTIDFGVRWQGYHSDETVTLAVGAVSDKLQAIYATVLAAHDLAIHAVRAGLPLREIDALARNHIAEKGYGKYFGHGLGHGVGLEIHEYPTLSPRSEDVAEEGMVVTIEPGIYIPEIAGVRIEDMIRITGDGCEVLTQIPKSLRPLPC